jgi:hypothetical protein
VSGSVVQLVNKRDVDFSGGNGTVVAVRSVDVSRWTSAVLNVRVHSNSINGTSSGTIQVIARAISLTNEEPQTDFIDASALATCTIGYQEDAGILVRDSLAADFGGALQITFVGTLGTSTTLRVNISVELVLKD